MSLFGNPVLAGSAGQGPSADLGDTIEQSLRFRGSQRLKRTLSSTSNRKTFTYSFWLKLTVDGVQSSDTIWQNGDTSGNNLFSFQWLPSPSWGDFFRVDNYTSGNQVNLNTSGTAFRDPSAWYHVVLAVDTTQAAQADRVVLYVNNQEITWGGGNTYPSQNFDTNVNVSGRDIAIGSTTVSSGWFNGYLASFQFIDGTALSPTDFGKPNDDGVWVPQDYTGTYGTNGFHLKFDSSGYNGSGGIGADHSGNGNDFTASGFDTADVALYSKDVFTSPTPFNVNSTDKNFLNANNNGKDAFDGSASSWPIGLNSSVDYCIWRPSTPIENVTSLKVEGASNFDDILVNGTSTGQSTSGSTLNSPLTVTLPSSPLTLTSFAVEGASGTASQNYFARISLGTGGNTAVVLVDNTDNDVDYLDTPTSNYATGNPIDAIVTSTPSFTYDSANLAGIGAQNGLYFGLASFTISLNDTNNYYWEIETTSSNDAAYPNLVLYQTWGSSWVDELFIWYRNGNRYFDGTTVSSALPSWNVGDICGMRFDGSNDTVYCSVNGGTETAFTLPSRIRDIRPGYLCPPQNSARVKLNFGQMPFIYQPANSVAMQTNNLPEPTIKNGKEHFETIIWDGNDVDDRAITTTEEFAPDLVWIKCRDSALNHELYDTVRGAPNRLLSNLNNEEDSPVGNLKSFTSTGFTLGDSGNVNGTGNEYVAWCWKAGGTAVSNNDGTISSSVSANTDAGFSIVKWQRGTNTTATIGHELNSPPEFIISKAIDVAENWSVYHVGAGNNGRLRLNATSAFDTSNGSQYWNNTTPSSTVFTVGNGINTNQTSDMIAYCWHSVEGFSKFGKYTGNGSTDGVFVYLGFKPALLVIRSLAGRPTMVYDSARNTSNPLDLKLYWNYNQFENQSDTISTNIIDFLSNGFKLRHNSGQTNALNEEYIFMAWAENPFGGENAPPATAR